jgi:hypothetical protein
MELNYSPSQLLSLYSRNPDAFYLILEKLDYKDLIGLCRSNKKLNDIICKRKGRRNIWKERWLNEISEDMPVIDIRRAYIEAKENINKLNIINDPEILAGFGYDKLLPKALEKRIWDYDRALYGSISNRHLKTVEFLVSGKWHSQFLKYSDYALRLAIESGDLDIVDLLVKAGANLNPKEKTPPLSIAAERNDIEMVEYLLENGATEELSSESGFTTALEYAVNNRNIDMIELLIGYGANPAEDIRAFVAAIHSRDPEIIDLFIDNGATTEGLNDFELRMYDALINQRK